MTLMRALVDKRFQAALAGNASIVFAHGLGGTPDTVDIRFTTNIPTTSGFVGITAPVDGTNVTIQNCGASPSPDMEIVSMRFHTIIQ